MAFLEVRDLKKSFGKTVVLRGVSFSLEKGEVLAVIGSSGSGKTTLLRCMNFLEHADGGDIVLNGTEFFSAGQTYSDAQIRSRRLKFGLVFQSFNLFPQYTAMGNLCLAARLLKRGTDAEIREKAGGLLEKVGLSGREDAYPCELSGGQQQRVAIARALMLEPEVLCFDEPTSALDPELTGEVLRAIRELKSGDRTMIIVTHEMSFARRLADRALFMAGGVAEESGRAEDLFDRPRSEKLRNFLRAGAERAGDARPAGCAGSLDHEIK